MQIAPTPTTISNDRRKDPKIAHKTPFELDESDAPFGMTIPLPSPFMLLTPAEESSNLASKVALAAPLSHQIAEKCQQSLSCYRENGVEVTTFQLKLSDSSREEPLQFEVKFFDTAQNMISVELSGTPSAIAEAMAHLPQLFAIIAANVYPYELSLILPPSIRNTPLNSVTIKELFKEQRTVYGVNEDEQAP